MFASLVALQRAMRHCSLFSAKRPKWKGPYALPVPADLKIYKRTMTILPQFVGKTFQVYNGIQFVPVKVTEERVGHKFAEFVSTSKPINHPAKFYERKAQG